jgi:homeobox protein cut-like
MDEDAEDDGDHNPGLGLRLPNPNATKANDKQGNSLEALLAMKNKRILEELTRFRVSHMNAIYGYLNLNFHKISDFA